MGGVAAGRMSGATDLLRYSLRSSRRTARAGSLSTGVSARRHAGGLAVRSSGALDGASRDVDRGVTPTAGGGSLPGGWGGRYHAGIPGAPVPPLFRLCPV